LKSCSAPATRALPDLAAAGAQVQRPLWASTSMKDPKRRDTLYVEELIAPHTVNTVPPATIDAFRDHGLVVYQQYPRRARRYPDRIELRLHPVSCDIPAYPVCLL